MALARTQREWAILVGEVRLSISVLIYECLNIEP